MRVKDIAKLANVSEATVSLTLNNRKGVGDATREKIIAIAKQYGYKIKTPKSSESAFKTIRFLACVDEGSVKREYNYAPFFESLIQQLTIQCNVLGYNLILSSVAVNCIKEELLEIEKVFPSDGIMLLGTNLNENDVKVVMAIQKNLVVVDNLLEGLNVNSVAMNNVIGGKQQAEHILSRKHRKIAYAHSKNYTNNLITRRTSFVNELDKHGIALYADYCVTSSIDIGSSDFTKIIREANELPTAIGCENDYIAISIIKSLQENGYVVPRDVAVIGFDNIENSKIVSPELTTINVPIAEISSIAMKVLVSILKKDTKYSVKYAVETALIKRKTT